jgi:hypothetical protein
MIQRVTVQIIVPAAGNGDQDVFACGEGIQALAHGKRNEYRRPFRETETPDRKWSGSTYLSGADISEMNGA